MKNDDSTLTDRRGLLGGIGVAALATVALSSAPASAQQKSGKFEPRRHAQDAWMDALPGEHRVFVDTDSIAGGTNALRYTSNILNSHINAYEGSDQEMAMIICYRHASTALGFKDAMWEKYGGVFTNMGRPAAEGAETPVKNPQAASITGLIERGVHFAICNSATTMLSGLIARQTGQETEAVHAELVANIVPNGHMVPAGVMAVTRAQEYGYSLLYSAA